ncbi:hypothetical protein F9L33_13935 [Amylibacter sp. SFDW26]|uniref:hypothetical protein n=1 Tax=Amylibacter sp. SFDW26 TaxID=2652722 RepID=UPI00126196B3|nr:hypothetical protein [Amylibacter sp. SFDW26]KAB7610397.1 hypothetical protein F9L33_13935 [Amylibacter sp. SFDW26]
MHKKNVITGLSLAVVLSGCFETAEERETREMQFNGKTVAQIAAVIGNPTIKDKTKAVWVYKDTYIDRTPIQSFRNGKWITTGYRNQRVYVNCKYTASLSKGRVNSSVYDGNSCNRFAPKIKKK